MKYNKGEWAELYAFLKIIEDRGMWAADENLNKIPGTFYYVHKLHRIEDKTAKSYDLDDDDHIKVCFRYPEAETKTIIIGKADLSGRAKQVLDAIVARDSRERGAYEIQSALDAMEILNLTSVKSPSGSKGDLDLEINDHITNCKHRVEFSLKSYLGGNPTLLNPSKPARFKFEALNFMGDLIAINNDNVPKRKKVMRKVNAIIANSDSVAFHSVLPNAKEENIFERNLQTFDFEMPSMLAQISLEYFKGNGAAIDDLAQKYAEGITFSNVNLKLDFSMLEIKLTHLLLSIALGMVPNSKWEGGIAADGGYIVSKSDGDLLCFHVYNYSQLGKYLFKNTRFDTPSTSRYDYGYLYEQDSRYFFDLALQIRFK